MNAIFLMLALAAPAAPPPPLDSFALRVGLWFESPRREDTAQLRKWANGLVASFDRLLGNSGLKHRASLASLRFVARGALPLAGGDPRHHPDLRATGFDLVWGVPASDSLGHAASLAVRTWLANCGCLDESGFSIGWDQFALPELPSNRLDRRDFPIVDNRVHKAAWSLLPEGDAPLAIGCRRAIQRIRAGNGTRYSDALRLHAQTDSLLGSPIEVLAVDGNGRPASGALLELWRGHPDASRPYGTRLSGPPDSLRCDDSGRIFFSSARTWLCDTTPWTHGRRGSCGTTYWRLSHAHRSRSGWMDAVELLSLPDSAQTLLLHLALPAGSSASWKEASSYWPAPWLAAQTDTSGVLTLGISVPTGTLYAMRILDEQGREISRFQPMRFDPGVYEKRIEHVRVKAGWDVRLDAPSSRLQSRIQAR